MARTPDCRRAVLILSASLVLAASTMGFVAADSKTLFLRVRSALVRTKPSVVGDGKTLALLGQPFEMLERSKDRDWLKVRAQKKEGAPEGEATEGWLHATLLSEHLLPPEEVDALPWLKDGAARLTPEQRRRGPAERHAQQRRMDLRPVYETEARYPAAAKLEEFLREGKLGVYRIDWPSLVEGVEP